MTGGTGTASVRTRDPMSEPAHPRDRHPSQRRARAARHAWAPAPALVAAILSVPVLVVAAALLVWRPDWRDVQPAVVIPWALLLAGAAALTGWHLTRHRAQLVASAEAATALALEREERLDLIVSSLHEGLLFQDAQLRIQEFNESAAEILGLTERSLGRRPDELGPWQLIQDDGSPVPEEAHPAVVALRTGTRQVRVRLGLRTPTRTRWLQLTAVPVIGDGGAVEGVITTFSDVTEARDTRHALATTEAAATSAAEALSWQVRHDSLTELPNRAELVARVEEVIARRRRAALLTLDLDRFKQVNDTLGHEAGDRVLVEVARRLRDAVRSDDVVARIGGDEFAVLPSSGDRTEVVNLAERLRAVVARPLWLSQGTITLSTSVGIAFDTDGEPTTLLRDADTALHKAKEQGRDRVEVFDDSLRAETVRRAAAEQILRTALDEDGLRILYQPIVDLHTGQLVGAEALLRVIGPHRELLTPASFINVAEDTGLIVPLGSAVLEGACAQLRDWQRDLGQRAPRHVAVNVAARQLTSLLPGEVEAALDRCSLDPGQLVLELTETALIEAGREALDAVEHLHGLGVRFAIDDFGTGYSSLAYLKRFPVDIVKIDRSFTRGLGQQQHDTEIVRAVVALARSLRLTCVAEGVETEDQLLALRDLGCDHAQGYLLSRPVPGDELGGVLDRIAGAAELLGRADGPRHIRVV